MSIFDGRRLPVETFKIDVSRMRRGWYSDDYFLSNVKVLSALSYVGYCFGGTPDICSNDVYSEKIGDIEVEMQFFARRKPFSLIAGTDEALAILKECVGFYDDCRKFVNMYDALEIEIVDDGTFVYYNGSPADVQPVLKIRGKYRYFAHLETVILGVLGEATRIATNAYNMLVVARGKRIVFFPARFAHYKNQAIHGYAYTLAVLAYEHKYGRLPKIAGNSNDAFEWWNNENVASISHSSICCFYGDATEAMMQFSRIMPAEKPRIALVDFHNDCCADTADVMKKMFSKYLEMIHAKKFEEAKKYVLYAVRIDTAENLRDCSVPPIGDKQLDCGVNPRLVWNIRNTIDNAYIAWKNDYALQDIETAKVWCKNVKIIVTGGFNVDKIRRFEELSVPVDIYGVGSSLLENGVGTNNDFTADIVKVKCGNLFFDICKHGRVSCENPFLKRPE